MHCLFPKTCLKHGLFTEFKPYLASTQVIFAISIFIKAACSDCLQKVHSYSPHNRFTTTAIHTKGMHWLATLYSLSDTDRL
jgi:hypothetical protein